MFIEDVGMCRTRSSSAFTLLHKQVRRSAAVWRARKPYNCITKINNSAETSVAFVWASSCQVKEAKQWSVESNTQAQAPKVY